MRSSYGIFAKYYDVLTGNIDYGKRALYFNELVHRFGGNQHGILLDLACGTGSLSEEMSRLGYDVIAVDNSQEMLSAAIDKKFESGSNIQYLCQDMCELDMFGTIDVTICALDSLNHLDSIEAVRKVFSRVHLFCEPGGLFIFDINTEYKHRMVLGENTFVYDTDDVYCVWQNSCSGSKVTIDLDFFVPQGDSYRRYEESFCENAYSLNMIREELENVGFSVLACYDGDSFDPPAQESQRVVFVAGKSK